MLKERIPIAYCNCLAEGRGLDPGGHGATFEDGFAIEVPPPWPYQIYSSGGGLPPEIVRLLASWLERYRAGAPYGHRPLLLAPDLAYSVPGHRRVMFYRKPAGAFARFAKTEYLVPDAELGPLLWAWFEDRAALDRFDAYREPAGDTLRDLMVCTHGRVDVACGKFGFPLYRHLRRKRADARLRVWRVSHFGGHVFAPTVLDMPTGHYWGYVREAQGDAIAARAGEVSALRGHYRGWAGLEPGFLQAAERELWQSVGWPWIHARKSGAIVRLEPDAAEPRWADVCIRAEAPDGAVTSHHLHVERAPAVETEASTGDAHTRAFPQFAVTPAAHASLDAAVA